MPLYNYTLANGERRYRVQIRRRGHRHQKDGFRSREAAKAYERRYLDALYARLAGTDLAVTVQELAEHWLEHMRPRLKPSTWRDYESSLRLRILPDLGHLQIREVTPLLVLALNDKLARDRTPRTVNKTVAPLRATFRQAVAWGILTYNPTADVRRVPERRREIDCLSEEEVARLLEASEGRDRTLIAVALGTGLRQGEILALRWGDIDWFRDVIHVRRTWLNGEYHDPKMHFSRRDVVMSSWLRGELAGHFDSEGRPGPDRLVFPSRTDTPLARANVNRRILNPALDRAKLRKVSFHSSRHTYASVLLSRGADVLFVSR
ncbi:MAG: site-specific integrase [Actinobacteria bacterium]|nr:site-specific integrase [Actinomycetota bacterium]